MPSLTNHEQHACAVALQMVIRSLGTQERLADICGVTPQAISEWHRGAGRVPIQYVERISRETDIPPAEIRPDLGGILLGGRLL